MKDQPLTIRIENEELVIRIGISALAYGCFYGDEWGGQVITNELQFAKDVMHELANEDEQGSTKFHFLLDDMAFKAAENGSLGVGEKRWHAKDCPAFEGTDATTSHCECGFSDSIYAAQR